MNKTEFYKGWSIMIFDAGLPGKSERLIMAVKGARVIDIPGVVADDHKAIDYAKALIDKGDSDLERNIRD